MATALTIVDLPDPYETNILNTPIDVGLEASDITAGNEFRNTGREFVLAFNNDIAPQTVTVTSQPASRTGRLGDITAASIPASGWRIFQIFPPDGWSTGGLTLLSTSDVDLQLAVLRGQLQGAG